MKTASGKISFFAPAVIAIVVVVAFVACPRHKEDAATKQWTLSLTIHGKPGDDFLEVKDKDQFHRAMCDVKSNNGDISDIRYQPDARQTPYPSYEPCSLLSPTPSSSASQTSGGGDPNATQHVRVNRPQDLQAVLAAFAEPSPTP
jgi:hypothetical protein